MCRLYYTDSCRFCKHQGYFRRVVYNTILWKNSGQHSYVYDRLPAEVLKNKKMDDPKSQVVSHLKDADHILITVSNNPTVDQLSAAIGLTLFLNKLNKHATAVFSGAVPSTLEFLKPDRTLEKNTDSLRDFIISLDKSKADKLRYKIEDEHVKIFITPYRTSINENDLNFEQGDFNVEAVVALGVIEQRDIDAAITAHGRILHDATVMTITTSDGSQLGSVNWVGGEVSSLCEMVISITEELKHDSLDAQIATAFLTGIVAETERFSNDKTTSDTMSVSARLMAAGANQQLVASELEKVEEPEVIEEPIAPEEIDVQQPPEEDEEDLVSEDGTLRIGHDDDIFEDESIEKALELPEIARSEEMQDAEDEVEDQQIHIDDQGTFMAQQNATEDALLPVDDARFADAEITQDEHHKIISKPRIMSTSAASSALDPTIDPSEQGIKDLSNVSPTSDDESPSTLSHEATQIDPAVEEAPVNVSSFLPSESAPQPSASQPLDPVNIPTPVAQPAVLQEQPDTLADLERAVGSPHATQSAGAVSEGLLPLDDEPEPQPAVQDISQARNAVDDASRPDPTFQAAEQVTTPVITGQTTTVAPTVTAEAQLPQFDMSQLSQPAVGAPTGQAPPPAPPPLQTFAAASAPQPVSADQLRAQAQPTQRTDYNNPFDLPPI